MTGLRHVRRSLARAAADLARRKDG